MCTQHTTHNTQHTTHNTQHTRAHAPATPRDPRLTAVVRTPALLLNLSAANSRGTEVFLPHSARTHLVPVTTKPTSHCIFKQNANMHAFAWHTHTHVHFSCLAHTGTKAGQDGLLVRDSVMLFLKTHMVRGICTCSYSCTNVGSGVTDFCHHQTTVPPGLSDAQEVQYKQRKKQIKRALREVQAQQGPATDMAHEYD